MAPSHQYDSIATALAHPDYYRRGYGRLLTINIIMALIMLVLALAVCWFLWQPQPHMYFTTSYAVPPQVLTPKAAPPGFVNGRR